MSEARQVASAADGGAGRGSRSGRGGRGRGRGRGAPEMRQQQQHSSDTDGKPAMVASFANALQHSLQSSHLCPLHLGRIVGQVDWQ